VSSAFPNFDIACLVFVTHLKKTWFLKHFVALLAYLKHSKVLFYHTNQCLTV